jgi:hypothetical protein
MLPEIKKFPTNWVDGMKVSSSDFIQMDEATQDWIRDARCFHLHEYAFGLLPSILGEMESFDYEYPKFVMKHDVSTVTIELQECRAITRSGLRFEITPNNYRDLAIPHCLPSIRINKDKSGLFDIFLSVNTDKSSPQRQSAGKSAGSGPPRLRYVTHLYELHIKTRDLIPNDHEVKIGEIRIENNELKIEKDYIPPCFLIKSHPALLKKHKELSETLLDIIDSGKNIIKTGKHKEGVLNFVDKVLFYTASSVYSFQDELRLSGGPIDIVSYFKNMANIIVTYIEAAKDSDAGFIASESKNSSSDNQDIKKTAKSLLDHKFNPNEITISLQAITIFLENLKKLFEKWSGTTRRSWRV